MASPFYAQTVLRYCAAYWSVRSNLSACCEILCIVASVLFPPACEVSSTLAEALPLTSFDPSCVKVSESHLKLASSHHPRPPRYPTRAIRERVSGFVSLRIQVSPEGQVTAASVVAAEPAGYFEEAALRAAQAWSYLPYPSANHPVCVVFLQKIKFRISEE